MAIVKQVITVTDETWKGDCRGVVKALADVLEANGGEATGLAVETRPARWVNYKKVTAKVTVTKGA